MSRCCMIFFVCDWNINCQVCQSFVWRETASRHINNFFSAVLSFTKMLILSKHDWHLQTGKYLLQVFCMYLYVSECVCLSVFHFGRSRDNVWCTQNIRLLKLHPAYSQPTEVFLPPCFQWSNLICAQRWGGEQMPQKDTPKKKQRSKYRQNEQRIWQREQQGIEECKLWVIFAAVCVKKFLVYFFDFEVGQSPDPPPPPHTENFEVKENIT